MQKCSVFAAVLLAVITSCKSSNSSPLGKVVELLQDLKTKIAHDGEVEMKAYQEYFNWCDEVSRNHAFAIKRAMTTKEKLEAKVAEERAEVEAAVSKIGDLGDDIAAGNSDLKKATTIRNKEASAFKSNEKELMDTVETLRRAMSVIEREMSKGSSDFMQLASNNIGRVLPFLSAVIDAAGFSGSDKEKLVSLVQAQEDAKEDAEDGVVGAPASDAYSSHSSNIMDLLEDLNEKAEEHLSNVRKAEAINKLNYEKLAQSLKAEIQSDEKSMADEKAIKSSAEEDSAAATGELDATLKELKATQTAQEATRRDCMQAAADQEMSNKETKEEIKVIDEAMKILNSKTSDADEQASSFVQAASTSSSELKMTKTELARSRVASIVKRLAREHHSTALAQLASRVSALVRYGKHGNGEPFAKVKGMIEDLISKLQHEAEADATEKSYCDEQLSSTSSKKEELDDQSEELTTKIDQAEAKSTDLKEGVKELQSEMGELVKEQAEMDRIRKDNHDAFVKTKEDLENSLAGVRKALAVLRDYYGSSQTALLQNGADLSASMMQPVPPEKHKKSTGAAQSIMDILELAGNDFATALAKEESKEADEQVEYAKQTKDNKLEIATIQQDIKFKTREFKALEQSITQFSSDFETASSERAAVNEFLAKLKDRCVASPDAYEERYKRRTEEIKGLKEALAALKSDDAFTQRSRHGRRIRGSRLSA